MFEPSRNSFEAVCRPILDEVAARIGRKFPQFKVTVGSCLSSANQGHLISVDAVRASVNPDEPNCLSLCVEIKDRDTSPKLCTLDVCWGGDGRPPCDGVDCIEKALPWGADALEKVREKLPTLEETFVRCLSEWQRMYA